jgi:radical SAM protein with 4Fe4S-binding SPASM domain
MSESLVFANDDIIKIYEYETTDGSFIPETPTKLGIWPKYEPKIYLDTSLLTPRVMIQGHDGSQTLAYGDYRDELILELEKRIFNNIKVKYDPSIFDINSVFTSGVYKKWNNWSAFSEDNCSTCKLLGSCRGGCPINYISEAYSSESYKCPPSKLFFNEHIFDRAMNKGLVNSQDWDNDLSPTSLDNLKICKII